MLCSAVIVPVPGAFHSGGVVHFFVCRRIVARHRLTVGRKRVEHSGRSIRGDPEVVDFPSGIVVALFENGIDLVISLCPIVLPTAPRTSAETGGKSGEAKETKKSTHGGRRIKIMMYIGC
jgi:hypothetical protein